MNETVQIRQIDTKWPNPTRALLIAPSQAGKSTLIKNLILHRKYIFPQEFSKIIYINPNLQHCLPHEMEFVQTLKANAEPLELETLSDIPSLDSILSNIADERANLCIIIDDMNERLYNDEGISEVILPKKYFSILIRPLKQNI